MCRTRQQVNIAHEGMVNMLSLGNESCLTSCQTSKFFDVVMIDMLAGNLVTVRHNRIWQTAEREDISL